MADGVQTDITKLCYVDTRIKDTAVAIQDKPPGWPITGKDQERSNFDMQQEILKQLQECWYVQTNMQYLLACRKKGNVILSYIR